MFAADERQLVPGCRRRRRNPAGDRGMDSAAHAAAAGETPRAVAGQRFAGGNALAMPVRQYAYPHVAEEGGL